MTRERCRVRLWVGAWVLIACGWLRPAALADDASDAFRRAAGKVAASVVTIETVGGAQPADGTRRGPSFVVADGPTTGLVWSADGLVLTSSFNFVRDPSVISVVLPDGRRFVAELLARDEIRRLAMLKIAAHGLPVPQWAPAGEMKPGQWAISLGRGHGRQVQGAAEATGECTLTVGIVSGLKRMSGLVIQTDAKLSPANFGGPLIDIEGRVLGICVPIGMDPGQLSGVEWYDSGIGFAVPREQAEISARDLADGHNVRRGLLGVALAPFAADAAVVLGCGDPSPALRAGIQPGDRILAIDEEPVNGQADLKRVLRPRSAGTKVKLRLKRQDQQLELPVTLAVPEDLGPIAAPSPESTPDPEAATRPAEQEPILPPSSGPA